ncbi:YceI family protein [Halobacteriovorax sp. GFR7]|uniref:YceI family protein n=1 Tax=unclassified Halobacteriovorax TaxID=2639665 RepID=UPI003D998469
MKFIKLLTMLLLLQTSLHAESKLTLKYDSYDKALEAKNRIFFNMSSTKAGIITTDFKGVVRDAKITYSKDGKGNYKDISIVVDTKQLDTDNDARNEKMYEQSLETEKYPRLIVRVPGPVRLGELNKGSIEIRNKKHSIDLFIEKVVTTEGEASLAGKSVLSLKKLEIPDPSIWIATVHDEVEVKFYVVP